MKSKNENLVSAVVPVFNEEKTVKDVISVLLSNPLINEVIVVNDGSTDSSIDILRAFGDKIILIDLMENKGKGNALAEGIIKSKNEIVSFFDSDLVGLTHEQINALFEPFLNNECDGALGFVAKSKNYKNIWTKLTGQRIYYKKDLLSHINTIRNSRFGVEVLLNEIYKDKKVYEIPMVGLRGLLKHEKVGYKKGLKNYITMSAEIALELGKIEGLLPKDLKVIKSLGLSKTYEEFKSRIVLIKNKKIKDILRNYVLKYIKRIREIGNI